MCTPFCARTQGSAEPFFIGPDRMFESGFLVSLREKMSLPLWKALSMRPPGLREEDLLNGREIRCFDGRVGVESRFLGISRLAHDPR